MSYYLGRGFMQDRTSKATTRNTGAYKFQIDKKDKNRQNKERNRLSTSKVGRSKKGGGEGIGGKNRIRKKANESRKISIIAINFKGPMCHLKDIVLDWIFFNPALCCLQCMAH